MQTIDRQSRQSHSHTLSESASTSTHLVDSVKRKAMETSTDAQNLPITVSPEKKFPQSPLRSQREISVDSAFQAQIERAMASGENPFMDRKRALMRGETEAIVQEHSLDHSQRVLRPLRDDQLSLRDEERKEVIEDEAGRESIAVRRSVYEKDQAESISESWRNSEEVAESKAVEEHDANMSNGKRPAHHNIPTSKDEGWAHKATLNAEHTNKKSPNLQCPKDLRELQSKVERYRSRADRLHEELKANQEELLSCQSQLQERVRIANRLQSRWIEQENSGKEEVLRQQAAAWEIGEKFLASQLQHDIERSKLQVDFVIARNEITYLQSRKCEAEARLKYSDNKEGKEENRIKSLMSSIKNSQEEVRRLEEERRRWKETCENNKDMIDRLKADLKEVQAENVTLEKQRAKAKEERVEKESLQKLRAELKAVQAEKDALTKQKSKTKEDNADKDTIKKLRVELKDIQAENRTLQKRQKEMRSADQDNQDLIEDLRREVVELTHRYQESIQSKKTFQPEMSARKPSELPEERQEEVERYSDDVTDHAVNVDMDSTQEQDTSSSYKARSPNQQKKVERKEPLLVDRTSQATTDQDPGTFLPKAKPRGKIGLLGARANTQADTKTKGRVVGRPKAAMMHAPRQVSPSPPQDTSAADVTSKTPMLIRKKTHMQDTPEADVTSKTPMLVKGKRPLESQSKRKGAASHIGDETCKTPLLPTKASKANTQSQAEGEPVQQRKKKRRLLAGNSNVAGDFLNWKDDAEGTLEPKLNLPFALSPAKPDDAPPRRPLLGNAKRAGVFVHR